MKPAITTITLLVANLLILGYIFLIDARQDSTKETIAVGGKLANYEPEMVTRVLLKTAEGQAEIVKLPDGSWWFTAPFRDRVDPTLISQLITDGNRLQIKDTVTEGEREKNSWDDKYFGFGEDSIKLKLFDKDGNTLADVELGGLTPFERTVYARRKGEEIDGSVKFVFSYLRDVVALPFNDLRDRRLIFAKADDVWRVKFRPPPGKDLEVHVEKDANNHWRMEQPLKTRCDEELVQELIGKLVKLQVAEIIDQPAADVESAFDDGRYEITLRQRSQVTDNGKLTITFGKLPADENDPYVLARVSDRDGVFRIDRRVHYEFGMDGSSLRARTLADIDYNAVSSVRIYKHAAQEEIILRRLQNAWLLQMDPADPQSLDSANGAKVKELIEKINEEEIIEFASDAAVDLEPYGLKDPALEIKITRLYIDPAEEVPAGGQPTLIPVEDTLMLGVGFINQPAGDAFAAFKGETYVYKIGNILPPAIAREKAIDFKSLQLWPRFTPFDVRKVTLKDKGNAAPLELSYDHQRNLWTAIQDGVDVTANIDRLVLDGYLQFIGRPPKGEEWTGGTAQAFQRLADPDLSVTIDLVDPQDQVTPRRVTFVATATKDGGSFYYGQVNRSGYLSFLNGDTIRALRMPLSRLAK